MRTHHMGIMTQRLGSLGNSQYIYIYTVYILYIYCIYTLYILYIYTYIYICFPETH